MPYRDPEKRRQAGRERQATYRKRLRKARFGGNPGDAPPPTSRLAADQEALPDETLPHSQRAWTQQKIAVGREVLQLGMESLRLQGRAAPLGGRDSLAAIRLGLDLLEANFELPPEVLEEKFPTFTLMADPEFRDLAERSLIRQSELMLQAEKAEAEASVNPSTRF